MDHATEKSVLADFNGASFDDHGLRSRFFRDGGKYFIETDGADGKLAAFEVRYTFGVYPLQQYLVEFADGRLQALPLAWDSRPIEAGGQRWLHLYPSETIRHGDPLHWTRPNQNWNFMCAGCHSTNVRKNYDAAKDRFATTWTDINVGCESCHGPGSRHVDWAQTAKGSPSPQTRDPDMGLAVRFDERAHSEWVHDPQAMSPKAAASPPALRKEVETCGLCHARAGQISEDWRPGRSLSETHDVTPIQRGLYAADGQMLDVEETYNYVPFKQSRMFAAGVTCSDCHDPHSAKLRLAGDATCLTCHSEALATSAHMHHDGAKPPLACVSCHMPARTYMVVDRRHDHSFRIPRPDLSATLGTPNACNDCHADKAPQWAASAIERWFGPTRKGLQDYAAAFHASWTGAGDAEALLLQVAAEISAPMVVRASALGELSSRLSPSSFAAAKAALGDPDPMVRIGALDALAIPAAQLWPLAAPLLDDPVRGVRIHAASRLAAVPDAEQPAADRERFARAAAEFIEAQRLNDDRPESRSAIGQFLSERGRYEEAELEYKAAIRIEPQFGPASINLADLYRRLGKSVAASEALRAAISVSPADAGLHHAFGLALVRDGRLKDALSELKRATELDPDQTRYSYVYAVALNSAGRRQEAVKTLTDALARQPTDRDSLAAMLAFAREAGDEAAALDYAERLARITPDDTDLARLIDALKRRVRSRIR